MKNIANTEIDFKYRRAKNNDLKSMAWLVTCNIGTCDLKPEIDVRVNDEARGIILDQIPLYYKNYYETLGPERLKALGYDKTNIAKEYSDLQFDVSKISDEVYKTFKPGQRYPRNTIKDMLCTIYSSLGYNKTPKANDLEQYFEIKECKVLNSKTNKREHGFEIIKIKEGDS